MCSNKQYMSNLFWNSKEGPFIQLVTCEYNYEKNIYSNKKSKSFRLYMSLSTFSLLLILSQKIIEYYSILQELNYIAKYLIFLSLFFFFFNNTNYVVSNQGIDSTMSTKITKVTPANYPERQDQNQFQKVPSIEFETSSSSAHSTSRYGGRKQYLSTNLALNRYNRRS